MEKNFQNRIQHVKQLAFDEKVRIKAKVNRKLMENPEACKAHGGPITEADIGRLDSLTYEQLVAEVGYLKKNYRFKRKVEKKFEG